jgi:CSLREA domain-containing protein
MLATARVCYFILSNLGGFQRTLRQKNAWLIVKHNSEMREAARKTVYFAFVPEEKSSINYAKLLRIRLVNQKAMRKNFIISVFCLGILAFGAAQAARAADFIVTTSQDRDGTCFSNNNCSLREAVKAANAAGGQNNIYFPQFLDGQTFELTLGELVFHNGKLNIQGASPYFVHIKGAGSRIFSVVNAARLELRGLRLTNGNGAGALSNGRGGAIYVENMRNCTLLLDGVTVSGNSANIGGAIGADVATTIITNSIISGNTATNFGGGLIASGSVTVENSSIVNNRSVNSFGGGAYFGGGTITVRNVTVSDNRAYDTGGIYYSPFVGADRLSLEYVTVSNNRSDDSRSGGLHCFGTGASAHMSIFYGNTNRFGSQTNPNVDSFCSLDATNHIGPNSPNPNFGPLTFDGVRPHFRPLLPGSGAIDAGAATGFPATDIRNSGRATDGNGDGQFISDLGAYEAASMVTNTADDSIVPGSLRRMIVSNPPNSEIIFDPSFFNVPRTIQILGLQLSIDKNLTIRGPGANLLTLQQGTLSAAIFVSPGKTLNLYDVRIAGGSNRPIYNGGTFTAGGIIISGSQSGGMYNAPGATSVLWYSNISGNSSTAGGGINNDGALYLVHSTISGNNSTVAGGGFYNNGLAYFVNSTISGNTSNEKGAGVYNAANANAKFINSTVTNNASTSFAGAGVWNENFSGGSTVRARNSIIAANISGNGNPVDFVGDFNNLGNNIVNNSNPGLAPLGFYGGITQTHALFPDSPALNAGNNCVLTDNGCGDGEFGHFYDQRGGGAPRRIGAAVDIGAFERSVALDQTSLPNGERTVAYNQQLSATRQTSLTEFLPLTSDENFFETLLAPFTFSVVSVAGQSLPPGLTLASNGLLSGTPTQAGTFTFTVKAADADGIAGVARYSVTIAAFNNPPTVSGATISRQAGSPVSGSTIATVEPETARTA